MHGHMNVKILSIHELNTITDGVDREFFPIVNFLAFNWIDSV